MRIRMLHGSSSSAGIGAVILSLALVLPTFAQDAASPTAPGERLPKATRVTSIVSLPDGDHAAIELHADGALPPVYSASLTGTRGGTSRIAVDLPAITVDGPEVIPVGEGGVATIKTSVIRKQPLITRVVLELDRPLNYAIRRRGNIARISFYEPRQSREAQRAADAKIPAEKEPTATKSRKPRQDDGGNPDVEGQARRLAQANPLTPPSGTSDPLQDKPKSGNTKVTTPLKASTAPSVDVSTVEPPQTPAPAAASVRAAKAASAKAAVKPTEPISSAAATADARPTAAATPAPSRAPKAAPARAAAIPTPAAAVPSVPESTPAAESRVAQAQPPTTSTPAAPRSSVTAAGRRKPAASAAVSEAPSAPAVPGATEVGLSATTDARPTPASTPAPSRAPKAAPARAAANSTPAAAVPSVPESAPAAESRVAQAQPPTTSTPAAPRSSVTAAARRKPAVSVAPSVPPVPGATEVGVTARTEEARSPERPANPVRSVARAAQVPAPVSPSQIPAAPKPEVPSVLRLTVGSGQVFDWPEATTRVALSDETIVRLSVLSPSETMLTGLRAGRSTLLVWGQGGRRTTYPVVVEPNLDLANAALRDVHASLSVTLGADERSVVMRGDVPTESLARQARQILEQLVPTTIVSATATNGQTAQRSEPLRIVSLVRFPGSVGTAEDRLALALAKIDNRISVRRVQRGAEPDPDKDSFILEGRVRNINSLVQAVVLAERQLGGTGTKVKSADEDRVDFSVSSGGASTAGLGGGAGAGSALSAQAPPKSGLAAQAARRLLLTSESGRVVSFLEIDALPQVLVSVRVLEIDRSRFRKLGFNLRYDKSGIFVSDALAVGSSTIPNTSIPNAPTSQILSTLGNLSGGYVGATSSFLAALNFLNEKKVSRSVSEPNILTLSGETASVLVGGSVPVPTAIANQVSVQTSYGFQQFGVRMDIRPTVDEQGVVALEVVPSIVSPTAALGSNAVPGFRIQRVETTARVKSGESLVLGGLISASQAVEDRRVPGLGWIPMFRSQGKTTENLELMFLITPRVIDATSPSVELPPLAFANTPSTLGASGLDPKTGAPLTFLGETAQVIGPGSACAEMRADASAAGPVIKCLLQGENVVVLQKQGTSYRVRSLSGDEGYVSESRLRVLVEKP